MKKVVMTLTVLALSLIPASGVALAATITGTSDPLAPGSYSWDSGPFC